MTAVVEVAAAVLLRETAQGTEFLLAQRPPGKVYAGYWEFPGGKVEAGETLHQALVRELHEELGITVDQAWPWLSCQFTYPHATVRLKFFRISDWHGEISPIEHSGFIWTRIGSAPGVTPILPANGPILRALELPPHYAITNACENGVDAELERLAKALAGGLRFIQIRDKGLAAAERHRLAQAAMALAEPYADARLLISDDAALARDSGAHGLHLPAKALMQCAVRPPFEWVGASCHSAQEIDQAVKLGLDFVLLSPVLPTASHPEAQGLGWAEFARLIERLPLPVFALGGMKKEMLDSARQHGAHGIALMRGWSAD